MKRAVIWLPFLVMLGQANVYNDPLLRTGERAASLQEKVDLQFLKDYLVDKEEKDKLDAELARRKAGTLARARESNQRVNDDSYLYAVAPEETGWSYRLDPVMNTRRKSDDGDSSAPSEDRSSSREFMSWKEEWNELWKQRKAETKNFTTMVDGDQVNMVAARPWGVPCGDPSQHDMPWGSCVHPAECAGEYRIYRGDYFCGRTQFVCCALNFHTYDLYQGLDASFEQSSMEIDSAAERERAVLKTPKERMKGSERRRKRRKRQREERKRKIQRAIVRIVKEVQRVLTKSYKNATKLRKKKTNTMKKFIKFLKKQYKLDRDSAKDIHEHQMIEIDQNFMNKLMEIKELNHDFMSNDTFRNIIINHTISLRTAKSLAKAYPELQEYFPTFPKDSKKDYTRQREKDPTPEMGFLQARKEANSHRVQKSARRLMNYRRREDTSHQRDSSSHRRGYSDRYGGNSDRRSRNSGRYRGHARFKRGYNWPTGAILRPRRRKYRDYDVEYGLMYS